MKSVDNHLLDRINFPSDLKNLTNEELVELSAHLRQFIIDAACSNPGHLGANLGVVELTVALHYVFDAPNDKIIWDVGHQAYPHKILTGRKNVFNTNRKYGGISGFPALDESEYDAFGVGHSSTSISAAIGIDVASKLLNEKRHIVAVIGDGSLTGGMALEALNHGGAARANLLVILNDNKMAIDPNVGALKNYLVDITTSYTYNKLKKNVWDILGINARSRRMIQRIGRGIKSMLMKSGNLFQGLGFRYFGPVDGHNVNHLIRVLQDMKSIDGPKILHVLTVKGKGYPFAEQDQTRWHAPGMFNKETGEIIRNPETQSPPSYQEVFGHTLTQLAEMNERIVGITPAMSSGCCMYHLMKRFPNRFFDVGIAEQHAVTFAAGLAVGNLVPVCNIYSSFLQRGYDQIIHDVALQKLPVILCIDRAGLVGEDGATHHGAYDMAYLRCIPDVIVSAPMNEIELRNLMFTAQSDYNGGLFAIRYPKGSGVTVEWESPFRKIPIGKGRIICEGGDIAFVSIGTAGNMVVESCKKLVNEGIKASHYDMRFLKPIDEELLHNICQTHKYIITVEDGTIVGGLGSAVIEFANDNNYSVLIKRLGIPDRFILHGAVEELYRECGFDAEGIIATTKSILKK